jgi:hypothetical protein
MKRPKRIRYSIAAMLAAMALMAMPLAWLRHQLNVRAGYHRSLQDMQIRGAMMVFDAGKPRHWLYRWFDDYEIECIYQVSIRRGDLGDRDMSQLRGLNGLRQVSITESEITNEGLMHLTSLPSLERVYVASRVITEGDVEEFRRQRPDVVIHLSKRDWSSRSRGSR